MRHFLCFILATLSLTACTRKQATVSNVVIRFPQARLSQQKIDPALMLIQSLQPLTGSSFDSTPPSSLSEVDCYAVFVGADEAGMNESSCVNDNDEVIMRFGAGAGLFDKTATANLEVKSGPKRRIYIAGLKKINGVCQGPKPEDITPANYSYPYLLSSIARDLAPGSVTLEMTLQNLFSATNKMADCSFISTPPPSSSSDPIMQIASAYQHTCALSSTGAVKCWGNNSYGQLGLGDTLNRGDGASEMGVNLSPANIGGVATQIAVGAYHSCALLSGGAVKCWGYNAFGQLGLEDILDRGDEPGEMTVLPSVNLGTGRTAIKIAAGNYHTCALLDNFTLKCWGYNSDGQLGIGDTLDRGDGTAEMGDSLPVINFGVDTPINVFAGVANTCALLTSGSLKCWGTDSNGAVGNGAATDGTAVTAPAQVSGLSTGVVSAEIGYYFSCAVLASGTVKCWGVGSFGQNGNGSAADNNSPVTVTGVTNAVKLALGNDHACAILADGTLSCWGFNGNGGLGIDSTTNQTAPMPVLSTSSLTGVTAGNAHTCAIISGSSIKCWGGNATGELGLGDTASRGHTSGSMSALPFVDLVF